MNDTNVVGAMPPVTLDAIIDGARKWEEFLENLRNSANAKSAFEQGVKEIEEAHSRSPMPGPSDDQRIRQRLMECFEANKFS